MFNATDALQLFSQSMKLRGQSHGPHLLPCFFLFLSAVTLPVFGAGPRLLVMLIPFEGLDCFRLALLKLPKLVADLLLSIWIAALKPCYDGDHSSGLPEIRSFPPSDGLRLK